MVVFFFQAEDGIRDLVRSRGSEMCIRDRVRIECGQPRPGFELDLVMEAVEQAVVAMRIGAGIHFEYVLEPVSYTHLRAHETVLDLVCRLLLEKKKHPTIHCAP